MPPRSRATATMADIARLSGVSVTTVSHVINRTRPVRQETEAAVLSAIGEVGYRTASTRPAETRILGVATSAFSNPSFNELLHGIERTASRVGYSLLVFDTHDDVATELRAVTELVDHRVQAILLAASTNPAAALAHARAQRVPVVLLDRTVEDADVDQVASESVASVGQLVDHLADLGHTRIAMISGRPGLSTTEERVEGFRAAAQRRGVRLTRHSIVSGGGADDESEDAMRRLMTGNRPPTAVVAGNNRATLGAMRAARDLGLEIPRDLALVAYDDLEWADLFHPRLTVIAQPTTQLGEQAVDFAISRILNPDRATRRLTLATTFKHRESCGCTS